MADNTEDQTNNTTQAVINDTARFSIFTFQFIYNFTSIISDKINKTICYKIIIRVGREANG